MSNKNQFTFIYLKVFCWEREEHSEGEEHTKREGQKPLGIDFDFYSVSWKRQEMCHIVQWLCEKIKA